MNQQQWVCEHCGREEDTETELTIRHRSCRFKAAFPDVYTETEEGIVIFDPAKLRQVVEEP